MLSVKCTNPAVKLLGASKAVQAVVGNSFAVVSAVQISTSKSSPSVSSELTSTPVRR